MNGNAAKSDAVDPDENTSNIVRLPPPKKPEQRKKNLLDVLQEQLFNNDDI